MEIEVRPEPTPEEREAIARALARSLAPPPERERSGWWREGVRENVREAPEPGRAKAS